MFIVTKHYCKKYAFSLLKNFAVQTLQILLLKISFVTKFHCKKITKIKLIKKNYCKKMEFFIVKKFHCKIMQFCIGKKYSPLYRNI